MDIPIEIFMLGIGVSIALALFGFIRNPQIPAMLVFGGMFFLIFAIATDNIIIGSFSEGSTNDIVSYSQIDTSGLSDISAGASDIRGERSSTGSSQLVGDTIDCIDIMIRKVGAPTGSAIIGVYDRDLAINDPLIQSFGTVDISTISASVSQWYTFCLPLGNTYTIGINDVIGARYDGGNVTNALRVNTATVDRFDGVTTSLSTKADATNVWTDQTASDLTAIFYLRGEDSVTTTIIDYEFTEMPKVLFALFGVIMMLCGALMMGKGN